MAKIIKGGRHSKDPRVKYSIFYPGIGKYPARRSADPENYLHSRSRKVKKVRETFAQAVVKYSRMDIVTKQMYREAIRMRVISPLNIYMRRIAEEINKRIEERPPGPPPLPIPQFLVETSPFTQINVSPSVQPSPREQLDWLRNYQPWRYYRGIGQIISDEFAKEGMPNPSRAPFPAEIPKPEQNIYRDRTPATEPTYIVVEIDPAGLTGMFYEGYVWVKTEYGEIKRWIRSHKKEVIIIVAIGLFIFLGWEFVVGGGLLVKGGEVLVKEVAATPEVKWALGILGWNWNFIKDWYYKRLVLEWAKEIDLWAWNDTKSIECYKKIEKEGDNLYFYFYENNDPNNPGKLAAWVKAEIDYDNRTAALTWGCGESTDRIVVFLNGAPFLKCNIGDMPFDIVDLYNASMGVWGKARITWDGHKKIYAFEDRPGFGDEDYNDAYVIIEYDQHWNPISVRAIEGEHADEHFIYWRGNLIAHW